jgi:uncharacterized RDD family membrane protein YckC
MAQDMENVTFDTPPASVAEVAGNYDSGIVVLRWLGTWIDFIVLASFLLIPDYVLGNEIYRKTDFIWLGLVVAYFPVTESLWGKTLGKFITRIRVVNSSGRKPSLLQSVIRTLFRLAEVNPLLLGGIPAGICVLASKNNQRLGDTFARTYILKDKDASQIVRSGIV